MKGYNEDTSFKTWKLEFEQMDKIVKKQVKKDTTQVDVLWIFNSAISSVNVT